MDELNLIIQNEIVSDIISIDNAENASEIAYKPIMDSMLEVGEDTSPLKFI